MQGKLFQFYFVKYGFKAAVLYSFILYLMYVIYYIVQDGFFLGAILSFIPFFFFFQIFFVPIVGLLITAGQMMAMSVFIKKGFLPYDGQDKKIAYIYGFLTYSFSVLPIPAFFFFILILSFVFPENVRVGDKGMGFLGLSYFLITLPSFPLIFALAPKALQEYSENYIG